MASNLVAMVSNLIAMASIQCQRPSATSFFGSILGILGMSVCVAFTATCDTSKTPRHLKIYVPVLFLNFASFVQSSYLSFS